MNNGHVWVAPDRSGLQECLNPGCMWVRIAGGIVGDARVRYAESYWSRAILKPRPCAHTKETRKP